MTFLTPLIAGIAAAIAIPALVILYFLKLRRRDMEVSTTLLWKKAIEDLQANAPFQKLRNNILLFLQLIALALALLAIGQPQFKSNLISGLMHVILIDTSGSMNATDGDTSDPKARTTRLEEAKRQALEVVSGLREPGLLGESGDKAMVITFDSGANVRQNFTSSKSELRAAIESIQATDGATSIKEAVKLAKAYSPRQQVEDKGLVSASPTVIHIFSDGGLPEIGEETSADAKFDITADDKVLYHPIGSKTAGNIGITGLRADRAFDKPSQLQIFVGLQSSFQKARNVDIQVAIDGQVVGVKGKQMRAAEVKNPEGRTAPPRGSGPGVPESKDLAEEIRRDAAKDAADQLNAAKGIKPEPSADKANKTPPADSDPNLTPPPASEPVLTPSRDGVVFSLDRPEGGIVTIRLIHPTDLDDPADRDVLVTDDIAYVSVPPAKRLSVAMVTPGNLFLREALEGLNLAKLEIIAPGDAQAFINSKRSSEFDVIILDRFLPDVKPAPGSPLDAKPGPGLPSGRFLVIGSVPPPPLGLVDKGKGEATVIVDWVRNHPVMANVGLETIVINPGRLTELAEQSPAVVLAQAQGGPAIVETSNEQTRAIIVTFDIYSTNWPFDPGFVLFTAAALQYLANDGAVTAETYRPGATISDRLPASARNATLGLPDKTIVDLVATSDGRVLYGPIHKVGVYTLSWEGPATATDVIVSGRPRRAVTANLLDPIESNIATREKAILATGNVETAQQGASKGAKKLWPYLLLAALGMVLLEWWVYNRKVTI